jgi:hypothetical protein
MSTSLRIDPAELISGALVIGDTGLGARADAIPAVGEHGPSYLYPSLNLPADAPVEIRGLIVTPPASGTLFAYEDGSFVLSGAPDGTYNFAFRVFVDGVDRGVTTATASIGGSNLGATITFNDVIAAGSLSGVVQPVNIQQAMLSIDFAGRLLIIAGGDIRSAMSKTGQLVMIN